MSDSQERKQPSSSPRRKTYDWYIMDQLRALSIHTSPNLPSSPSTCVDAVPDPERNQYSNKQSVKVNAGLDSGLAAAGIEIETDPTSEVSAFNSNASTLDTDFSQFAVPVRPFPPSAVTPSVEQLAHILLHPQPHAFLHGVLSMQWVMGALGYSHFRFRDSDERYILAPDSSVRTEGARLGLPPVYMEWLCGDNEESSPTEQAMLLTPKFFEGLQKEKEGSGTGK